MKHATMCPWFGMTLPPSRNNIAFDGKVPYERSLNAFALNKSGASVGVVIKLARVGTPHSLLAGIARSSLVGLGIGLLY